MKCTIAPFFRSYISNGLGEVPAMAVKVLSVVLALAVGMVRRFRQDYCAILACPLAVNLGVFDTNLNDMRIVGFHLAFSNGKAAIPGFHLDTMIGNPQSDGKAKSL